MRNTQNTQATPAAGFQAALKTANALIADLSAQLADTKRERDAARAEIADLRAELADTRRERDAAKSAAQRAEARRQYESADAYNQRINDALRRMREDEDHRQAGQTATDGPGEAAT